MKLITAKHDLDVEGLEYDPHATQSATLAGFDSLTIDGKLTLSYSDLMEMPVKLVKEIWQALEKAAVEECESWERDSRELRAWVASRR